MTPRSILFLSASLCFAFISLAAAAGWMMEHPWPPDGYDKGKAHCRYHAVKDRYGRSYLFNLLLPREWKKLCAARWENGKNPLMRAIEAFCEYSQEGVAHRSVYDYPAHFSSPYVTVDGGELCVLDFQIIEHVEAEASLPEYTPDIFDCVEEALACLGHSQSLEIPETCEYSLFLKEIAKGDSGKDR